MHFFGKMMPHSEPGFSKVAKPLDKKNFFCALVNMSSKIFQYHEALSNNLHKDCVRLVNRSSRINITQAVSKFVSTNDSTCEHILNKEEDTSLSTTDYETYMNIIRIFFWNVVTCGCFSRI